MRHPAVLAVLAMIVVFSAWPVHASPAPQDVARVMIEQNGGLYANPRLSRYVSGVGLRLVDAAGARDRTRWQFLIVDSPVPNAFAVPGGPVILTRGIVALAIDEAELAAVIAHEIGHKLAGHGEVGSIGGGSRIEAEADRIGMQLIVAAGYDPRAQGRLQARMLASDALVFNLAGFPPQNESDLAQRQRVSAREGRDGPAGERGRARFLQAIDGMAWGPQGSGLRIVVRRIAPGEDVVALASAMPVGPGARARFDLLNGLTPGQSLRVGDWVKLIAR